MNKGKAYQCTAEDSAYATFELENGIIAHFNSSWCVRVRRDDLLTIQVDGTQGSAVAGLRECYTQHYGNTPKPVWNPDIPQPIDFFEGWSRVPEQENYENAFKVQWELFLKHVVKDDPFPWDMKEGAKGVQLAEAGLESWAKRCLGGYHELSKLIGQLTNEITRRKALNETAIRNCIMKQLTGAKDNCRGKEVIVIPGIGKKPDKADIAVDKSEKR